MPIKFAGFDAKQINDILAMAGRKGPPLAADEAKNLINADKRYNAFYNRQVEKAIALVEGTGMATGGFVFPSKNARGKVNTLMSKDNPEFSESIVDMQAAQVNKMENQFPIPEQQERRFAEGGTVNPAKTFLDAAQQKYSDALAAQQAARDALTANPADESFKTALEAATSEVARLKEAREQATAQFKETATDSAPELLDKALTDPESMTTTADTATTTDEQAEKGLMEKTEGAGEADTATGTTAETAADVVTQPKTDAAEAGTTGTTDATEELMKEVDAATGEVSDDATVVAAEKDPTTSESLDVEVEQITDPTKVEDTEDRKVEDDELIAGSTVDMDKVKEETNFEAATGSPSTDATVKGQLTELMKDFEGGDPPPWAAGAMRAATAAMAARGLGASSMAGQAIIQAAMESALPIAQIDAATFSRFEEQNLSNKQQAAMFAAEKRAQFLGIEFDQEFQTRVANAAKVSDIANMNFTADQQVAIENARLAQTANLANLDAKNAKVMADAATIAQLELANLNNRQQAQVENAKSFLQMDLANLDNEQQAELFKTQTIANSILSDAAAENAAAQFNASSENQTNQFFASMANQVAQFNNEQTNAMNRFNAGETNALAEFNTTQKNLRGQFNAQNSLIIDQANAEWYQKIATTDNAATNQANRDAAAAANNMTTLGFGAYMQEVRDLMSYSWQTANNDADRATNLAIAKVAGDANMANAKAKKYSGLWTALGAVVGGL